MSVQVELHHHKPDVDTVEVFDDSELPPEIGGRYCYHVAAGGDARHPRGRTGGEPDRPGAQPLGLAQRERRVWRKEMLLHWRARVSPGRTYRRPPTRRARASASNVPRAKGWRGEGTQVRDIGFDCDAVSTSRRWTT